MVTDESYFQRVVLSKIKRARPRALGPMTAAVNALLEQAMQLSAEERAEVANAPLCPVLPNVDDAMCRRTR